jgi:peptidoglycan/xylan/chitin deacetylase (PgdA/CDA1 family)
MLFFLIFLCGALFGNEILTVEIALTFDDFPMGNSFFFEKQERAKIYAETLKELSIQAAFFCIGEQVECDDDAMCMQTVAGDHLLANHSFRHLHLSELSLEGFEDELKKTETLLSHYSNYRKWFRFPYLDYGDRNALGGTDRKRCAAFLLLRQEGYQHGYVTINTFDWYVDGQLKKAAKEGKKIDWDQLKKAYLSLLDVWIDAYHKRWSGVLQKHFVHVLLLHSNDLNAFFLQDIVKMIRQKNWVIVTPEKAFQSPIPFLSYFVNTKKKIFKGVTELSTGYVDHVLAEYKAFGQNIGCGAFE